VHDSIQCRHRFGAVGSDQPRESGTDIKQNLVLILDSGKTLTISEATDPISDRKVSVEVKATILK